MAQSASLAIIYRASKNIGEEMINAPFTEGGEE